MATKYLDTGDASKHNFLNDAEPNTGIVKITKSEATGTRTQKN